MLCRFPYFSKFAPGVRAQLIQNSHVRLFKQGEIIFKQDNPSPHFFFLVRGSVALTVEKPDMGNIPVVFKILYDGQDFGEQVNL